jgi:hypothetical protein
VPHPQGPQIQADSFSHQLRGSLFQLFINFVNSIILVKIISVVDWSFVCDIDPLVCDIDPFIRDIDLVGFS